MAAPPDGDGARPRNATLAPTGGADPGRQPGGITFQGAGAQSAAGRHSEVGASWGGAGMDLESGVGAARGWRGEAGSGSTSAPCVNNAGEESRPRRNRVYWLSGTAVRVRAVPGAGGVRVRGRACGARSAGGGAHCRRCGWAGMLSHICRQNTDSIGSQTASTKYSEGNPVYKEK